MAKFKDVWDREVRALADACVDAQFIQNWTAADKRGYATAEEEAYAKKLGLKDPYGMWYIADMIWRVEHDLADRRIAACGISVAQIYSTLDSDSYLQNVWGGDTSSEEAQRLFKLRDGLAS